MSEYKIVSKFDEYNNTYAVCDCLNFSKAIEVPRKDMDYFASFTCPQCGRELGIYVRAKEKNSSGVCVDIK